MIILYLLLPLAVWAESSSCNLTETDDVTFTTEEHKFICAAQANLHMMSTKHYASFTRRQHAFLDSLATPDPEHDRDRRRRRADGGRLVRQEYRALTFHLAMQSLREEEVEGESKWSLLVRQHTPDLAIGAHWGPAFLPWHREYVLRFERALNANDASVSMPYWDTSLDGGLPDPKQSMLWTPTMLGNGNGHVVGGPFAYWSAATPLSGHSHVHSLYRQIGSNPIGRLMDDVEWDWLMERTAMPNLTYCNDAYLESRHGWTHVWVGGYLQPLHQSPNDPAFFLFHAYIDYMWEMWRQRRQTTTARETEYGDVFNNVSCTETTTHGPNEVMHPFGPKTNLDGLSNDYTNEFYSYHRSPKHCSIDADCSSEFLFCHVERGRCRAKVQPGGRCDGVPESNPCYRSYCQTNSKCEGYAVPKERLHKPQRRGKWVKVMLIDDKEANLNTDHRPTVYVEVLRHGKQQSMEVFEVIPDGHKYGEYEGMTYVRMHAAPDIEHRLRAYDSYGRGCQAYCRVSNIQLETCNATFGSIAQEDGIAYSHSGDARRFLDMDMTIHPERWSYDMPLVSFLCNHEPEPRTAYERMSTYRNHSLYSSSPFVYFNIMVVNSSHPYDKMVHGGYAFVHYLNDNSQPVLRTNVTSLQTTLHAVNPYRTGQPSRLYISVRTAEGDLCEPRCMRPDGSALLCTSDVTLDVFEASSSPYNLPFTPDKDAVEYIGWTMRGSPHEWTKVLSPLRFYC